MYSHTIDAFAALAQKKSSLLKNKPMSFLIGAIMAGVYVGLGVILIFSLALDIPPDYLKLVMGCSFGIALTLIVFAGSELFTGHTMYMTLGLLEGRTSRYDLAYSWSMSWFGNFLGSIGLCLLFYLGGSVDIIGGSDSLLQKIATSKMNSPAIELFIRGALCNTLVCLALWASARTDSDSAKCIIIFWCLFAFIASGYEHSVANMTLLTLALVAEHSEQVTIGGLFYNLFWVTLGNILGGAGFVAYGYWKANGS